MISTKKLRLSVLALSLLVLPGFILQGCIGVRPSTPTAATISDGGIYKSSDGGKTWEQKIKIDEMNNISAVNVISVAIDPQNSSIMYMGSEGNGLYRSENSGDAWQRFNDPNSVLPSNVTINFIAIDPKNTDNIYLVSSINGKDRVMRSGDKGETWQEAYAVVDPNAHITGIVVDNIDPSNVFVTTTQGGLFKGINYGTDWRLVKWLDPGFASGIKTFVVNPKDNRVIYLASADYYIYKTTDGGNNWTKLFKDKAQTTSFGIIASLLIDPNNPSILYAGTNGGLLKTTDAGASWTTVPTVTPTNIAPIDVVAIDPINSQIVYYAINSILYKTIDGGIHWEIYNMLPTTRIFRTISPDPLAEGTVYIGTYFVAPPTKQRKPFQILPDIPLK